MIYICQFPFPYVGIPCCTMYSNLRARGPQSLWPACAIACAVRKPNEKGRVENGVGYVKKNFLSGLQIASFEVLNPAAIHWLRTVANVRIHGETHRKPLDLFEEEKARLKSLPTLAYDAAALKPVTASSRCRVSPAIASATSWFAVGACGLPLRPGPVRVPATCGPTVL